MHRFGKVAVLMGGDSAEREISLRSGAAVLAALQQAGVDAHPFDPQQRSLNELQEADFDRVFIALHGRGGEDGTVQGALEYMGMPYTGSGVLACALAMDKGRTKHIWDALELPVAKSTVIKRGQFVDAQQLLQRLGGKVMVKPVREGSSIGMGSASSATELTEALATAHQYDHEVLVEAWLAGPEYTVGIIGDETLPAIRLETSHEFYDYAAKYQAGDTQYHCPAGLSDTEERALQHLAKRAFEALGGSGWGRIDVMCDHAGHYKLLEANLVPGMTEKSLVPQAAAVYGLSFTDLVVRILELSMQGAED